MKDTAKLLEQANRKIEGLIFIGCAMADCLEIHDPNNAVIDQWHSLLEEN